MEQVIEVYLWGTKIGEMGYIKQEHSEPVATFEYEDNIVEAGVNISPIHVNSRNKLHYFPNLSYPTFKGLAGVFADSLPDKFGTSLIDIFMSDKGIPPEQVTPIDRLMYIADRSMGALEYRPSMLKQTSEDTEYIDIALLSELASLTNNNKEELASKLSNAKSQQQALKFIRVSASAGGARSKALVATKGGNLKDGTVDQGVDHDYWLFKFDNPDNADRDGKDPKGMTKVEYVYANIARECGINMPRTDYLEHDGDFHFMIERFDRIKKGTKLEKAHYVSWCGLAHAHRDTTGSFSYEQLALTCKQLKLPATDLIELFKRCVFNIVGRNQDDHTKNFGFIMDKQFNWSLSPAFDMTYSYDPTGKWTKTHQIKLNLKQDDFVREDLLKFAAFCNITDKQANIIIDQTIKSFKGFDKQAKALNVPKDLIETIIHNLRLYI